MEYFVTIRMTWNFVYEIMTRIMVTGFYISIEQLYGLHTKNLLKKLSRMMEKFSRIKNRRQFLQRSKTESIFQINGLQKNNKQKKN